MGGIAAGVGIQVGCGVAGLFMGPVGFAVAQGIGAAANIGTAVGRFDTIQIIFHLSSGRNYQEN